MQFPKIFFAIPKPRPEADATVSRKVGLRLGASGSKGTKVGIERESFTVPTVNHSVSKQ